MQKPPGWWKEGESAASRFTASFSILWVSGGPTSMQRATAGPWSGVKDDACFQSKVL